MDYLKLEFWNTCDTDINYEDGFHQRLYIGSDLVVTDPQIVEQGKTDKDNEFQATFQKFTNKYEIELMAPEYLLDALSGAQMCDNIWIYRKTGEAGKVGTLSMDLDWKFSDCYALCKLVFDIDYFTKNPCCDIEECDECTPTIETQDRDGADVILTGTPCNGFIQMQELVGGNWVNVGNAVTAGKYDANGVRATVTNNPATVRVWAYDNECDYGYSESVNE